jgi:predicted PurR-regulated permease PerM
VKRRSSNDAAALVLGTAAAVALLHVFRSILWPFAFACVIVVLIRAMLRAADALVPWANRRLVMAVVGICALGLLGLASLVVLQGVAELTVQLPVLLERIDGLLATASRRGGLEAPLTLNPLIGKLNALAAASTLLNNLRHAASGLMLTALFVTFLLISGPLIEQRVQIATAGGGHHTRQALERSIRGVETYLWLQTVTGLINAGASGLIMFVVGLNHWGVWTVALFMLSFIPFIGVAVGSVGPALFALLQFPSSWPSAVIFLGIQAVAFVVGNLVLPRLQATNQNIDPSAGLLALGAWSLIWGLPGAFLAIPVTLALIYQLAGSKRLRWIAVMMSHDGVPDAGAH